MPLNNSLRITDHIRWGLDRIVHEPQPLPDPPYPRSQSVLNLGPGDRKIIDGTIGVGRRQDKLTDVPWVFPEPLPFPDGSIEGVHMHHFLEHFTGEEGIDILQEVQRVLCPGGVVFITTPYPGTPLHYHALDHKSNWNEETWQWLFSNPYYNVNGYPMSWDLKVRYCLIGGIVERNVCLFTQLVKVREEVMSGDTLRVYQDDNDEWRWTRTAGNGEVVGSSSESYEGKDHCLENAWRINGSPDGVWTGTGENHDGSETWTKTS